MAEIIIGFDRSVVVAADVGIDQGLQNLNEFLTSLKQQK